MDGKGLKTPSKYYDYKLGYRAKCDYELDNNP